jgi:hypothetical protein
MSCALLRCVLIATLLLDCRNAPGTASGTKPAAVIEYRSQGIRLSKSYQDDDDYKNDPNNIAPEEYARVQALLKDAPVPQRAADSNAVLKMAFDLKFPGYGLSSFGQRNTEDGGTIIAEAIEIPHAEADRFVVYVSDSSGYRLADDVVLPERLFVQNVDIRGGAVVYLDGHDQVLVKRPMR